MRVLAFNMSSEVLHDFGSAAEALASCPQLEIAAQAWLFFAEDGSPLRAEQWADGMRFLRPWASCSSCSLPQLLPYVRSVAVGAPESLAALRARFSS